MIGRSPVEHQLAFARERGWNDLKFHMPIGDDFPRDYRSLLGDGSEMHALDVRTCRSGISSTSLRRRPRQRLVPALDYGAP